MSLFESVGHFLRGDREAILDRWRGAVSRDPSHPANRLGLDRRALDDHLPSLLLKLADCLLGSPPDGVEKEGETHGRQRREHGYSVNELLWEMSLFRQVVFAAVDEHAQKAPNERADDEPARLRRAILDLLDRSVHASVRQFQVDAEAERDAARAAVEEKARQLEEANARLEEADVQKDRLLSVVSHELRNPLVPILNAVEILKRSSVEGPARLAQYAVIERQARHLTRLVDDLLDVNRVAHGKLELRPEPMPLQRAVGFAIDGCHPTFEAKGVHLLLDLAAEPLPVIVDGTRIAQAVLNLLGNAVKFTPPGGSVTVALRAQDETAVLSVRDTGAGIAPEMLGRIFEPFAQGATSLEDARGGLGLGLMIARGLVEAHGGTIEAKSDGPGHGAELVIRLPLSRASSLAS